MMQALLIVCQRREIQPLLDAFEDWNEDAKIIVYGYTSKESDGFILIHWNQLVPIDFQDKQLKADPGIIDYVVYDVPLRSPKATTA